MLSSRRLVDRDTASRRELLGQLEATGPGGRLEHFEAAGVDLSSDVIELELEHFRASHGGDAVPVWYSERTRGSNFARREMPSARFEGGKVWRGDFNHAGLGHSNFNHADAAVSDFDEADLTSANFGGANVSRSSFRRATLIGTTLTGADLRDTDFSDASLVNVRLADVVLGNTRISRSQIEGQIAEERIGEYAAATTAYAALKVNFRGLGRFADASWAYIRERRMETKALAPWRLPGPVSPITRTTNTFRWLAGLLTGWIAGYGERPLRAFLWVPAIIIGYAVLYWRLGDVTPDGTGTKMAGFGDCLRHSLASFVTMSSAGASHLGPRTPGGQIWTSIEAMTGISLLALVMFSLGKRITRA